MKGKAFMAVLSRDQIFSKPDIETDEVDVPEWGGAVRIRSITAAQQKEIAKIQNNTARSETDRYARGRLQMVVFGCVDKEGSPLFTEDDFAALEERNPGVLNRLSDAIGRISGLSDAATDAAEGKATSG